jgi:hypothetical protein
VSSHRPYLPSSIITRPESIHRTETSLDETRGQTTKQKRKQKWGKEAEEESENPKVKHQNQK